MVKGLSAYLRRSLASFGPCEEFQLQQDVTTKHPQYRYHVSVCRSEADSLIVVALQCWKTVHTLQSFLTQKNLREEMGLRQAALKKPRDVLSVNLRFSRSQWPRGLRRGSMATRLLGLWVRIPPGGMDVCVECCMLSSRCPCDGLITRPEKSYRLWCVAVCDIETPTMRRPWPAFGGSAKGKKKKNLRFWLLSTQI